MTRQRNQSEISSPRLRRLDLAVRRNGPSAVHEFWARIQREGTPLVEQRRDSRREYWLTFLWRAERGVRRVGLRSALAGEVAADGELTHLPKTDVWYRTYSVRDDFRGRYQFAVNEPFRPPTGPAEQMRRAKRWRLDPFNPKVFRYDGDPRYLHDLPPDLRSVRSLVELPRAPHHAELLPRAGAKGGRLEEHVFRSRILKNERKIWVHIPAGVEPTQANVRVAVFFDGLVYAQVFPGPTILDNLVAAHRIPPVLSVFIGWTENGRARELCQPSPAFGRFLVQELLPWIKRTYRVRLRPERTMLVGASCGGLSALHWAAEYPEHFRLVLSQSGSFQSPDFGQFSTPPRPGEEPADLIRAMMGRRRLPIKVWMEAGLLEGNYILPGGVTLLAANRHMKDILRLKGIRVQYREFNGGHSAECWRETLVDGLLDLLGTSGARGRGSVAR